MVDRCIVRTTEINHRNGGMDGITKERRVDEVVDKQTDRRIGLHGESVLPPSHVLLPPYTSLVSMYYYIDPANAQ